MVSCIFPRRSMVVVVVVVVFLNGQTGAIPLTYFLRSSRFICSARSIMGGWASGAAGREGCGVPFAEEGMAEAGLRSGEGTGLWELERRFEGGTTRGEAAIM